MTHLEETLKPDVRRRAIVDAAIALADSEGLVAVTMRAVAGRLGVGTMTLYSYVEAKDELLDLMLEELSGEMLLDEPVPSDWREALTAIAKRTRAVLEAHPWMFKAATREPGLGVNFLRHVEQSRAAVASLALDNEATAAILAAVDDYTLGHALRARVRRRLARPQPDAGFERGLEWLLDGIEAWLRERPTR
jgi:AcrR family transcriptional regulator